MRKVLLVTLAIKQVFTQKMKTLFEETLLSGESLPDGGQ